MLTEREMREYIDRAERGELRGEGMETVYEAEPVTVTVQMYPGEVMAIDAKAREQGKTRGQLIRELAYT